MRRHLGLARKQSSHVVVYLALRLARCLLSGNIERQAEQLYEEVLRGLERLTGQHAVGLNLLQQIANRLGEGYLRARRSSTHEVGYADDVTMVNGLLAVADLLDTPIEKLELEHIHEGVPLQLYSLNLLGLTHGEHAF